MQHWKRLLFQFPGKNKQKFRFFVHDILKIHISVIRHTLLWKMLSFDLDSNETKFKKTKFLDTAILCMTNSAVYDSMHPTHANTFIESQNSKCHVYFSRISNLVKVHQCGLSNLEEWIGFCEWFLHRLFIDFLRNSF